MSRTAKRNCRLFETKAPAKLIPINETAFRGIFLIEYIKSPEEKVPIAEKRRMYEKRVPEIRAWPKTFISKRSIKAGKEKISIPKRRGRFAKPILKKGTGLGIIISIAERKKQNPPNKGIR